MLGESLVSVYDMIIDKYCWMLSRLGKSLRLQGKCLYSTQEKKNVIVVPKRYQIPFTKYNHLESEIQTALSCKNLAVLIKENLELFTDDHVAGVFNQIGYYDLPVDDHFHTVIAPIAVEWVRTFNREQATALTSILLTLTLRNISAPELEKIVVKKLDEENIYRYVNLHQTVALFNQLSKVTRFLNSPLFIKLQNVIYQQKAFYAQHPDLLKAIHEGLDAVEAQTKGEKPL